MIITILVILNIVTAILLFTQSTQSPTLSDTSSQPTQLNAQDVVVQPLKQDSAMHDRFIHSKQNQTILLSEEEPKPRNIGVILGVALGGIAFAVLIFGIVYFSRPRGNKPMTPVDVTDNSRSRSMFGFNYIHGKGFVKIK